MDDGLNSVEMEDAFDPEFTLAEILEMENLYKGMRGKSLDQPFYQEVAMKFSNSVHRRGRSLIGWEQVRSWFQDIEREFKAKISSSSQKVEKSVRPTKMATDKHSAWSPLFAKREQIDIPLPAKIPVLALENSENTKGVSVAELSELLFEAKSSKDFAWYDVASFLNYRVTSSGELEVRVRFVGYDKDEDEWLNVKRSVRERSIPLEPSECDKVKIGDVILCFRENEYDAVYCDARIVDIQRKPHDSDSCSCIFLVRYDADFAEGQVQLNKLCRRPAS